MSYLHSLRCLRCGAEYAPDQIEYLCACRPNTGSDLGTLNVQYHYAAIRQQVDLTRILADADRSIGRWHDLLPITQRTSLPPLPVGNTPLLHAQRLGHSIGLAALFLKDDGRNPSLSFKDRASAIAVARAQESKREIVATASTGNAAAALSAMCAAAGQANVIFVPKTAPQAKIAQLLVYGSTVLAVDGTYDEAFDLCSAACAEFGWYNRSTGINPYMTEGKKTVSFEIAEQLYQLGAAIPDYSAAPVLKWQIQQAKTKLLAPDAVFVSVGDGCIIGGVHKGFSELLTLGWIDRMPRIYGVQSAQSDALYRAWRAGMELPEAIKATTRADSISVNAPRDPIKALNAVRQTGGEFFAIQDRAILRAILPLARLGAVFAEPAGAAAYAGLLQALADKVVQPDDTVVVINTGSGLKDVNAAISVAGETKVIKPTLQAVKQALGR